MIHFDAQHYLTIQSHWESIECFDPPSLGLLRILGSLDHRVYYTSANPMIGEVNNEIF